MRTTAPYGFEARGGVHMFTTLRASVHGRALQTFRATRSMFTTLFTKTRVKVTHTYARSLKNLLFL